METHIYISCTGDGYSNLAVDEFILGQYHSGKLHGITLYFYVNDNAVIIGRNQNAWRECNIESMERDGVQLVRRHTGGGAVYHDKGNLNFSFITDEQHYDKARQTRVIASACSKLGIKTEISGRNDILADGRKFSGNAYAVWGKARGHHGTVLVSADTGKLSKYLNVSPQKLAAKGVASVRSRVCNLSEFRDVTVDEVRAAIIESFLEEYGGSGDLLEIDLNDEGLRQLIDKQSSWEWRFGKAPAFDHSIEHRFSFGELQLFMTVRSGVITEVSAYSDALDTSISDEICGILKDSRFDGTEIAHKLSEGGDACREVSEYILDNLGDRIMLNDEQRRSIILARHSLHSIPELSCEEHKTKEFIIGFLKSNTTLEIHDKGKWLYAVHREQAGETVAFRADFDAVPTGDGCAAHRCGHDGHTSALLGLSLLIEGKELGKSVVLLFQHAEETGVGAKECCELFEEEHIDIMYGCHNIPGEPMGCVLLKKGTFACASCGLQAELTGSPTHAAYPENGINPTSAIAELAIMLPQKAAEIAEKYKAMTIATIVGMYSGGKAFGVAASKGALYATLRSESTEALEELKDYALKTSKAKADDLNVDCQLEFIDVFPATVNDHDTVDLVERKLAAKSIDHKYLDVPFRWSEDFGHYGSKTNAVFFGIGSGINTPPLHTKEYEYPDELASITAEVFFNLL